MNRGFTLIELLLVIAITAILATFLSLSLFNFRAEQGLNDDVSLIVGTLRDAQQKSITQENDGQWGVRFDGANNWYEVFQVGGSSSFRRPLSPGVQFTDPSGVKEIIFAKRTGATTANTVTLARTGGGTSKTVTVNANGTVSY